MEQRELSDQERACHDSHTSCEMVILQSEYIQHLSLTNMCLLFLNVQMITGILMWDTDSLVKKKREPHFSCTLFDL
jgi:hypothetical protein